MRLKVVARDINRALTSADVTGVESKLKITFIHVITFYFRLNVSPQLCFHEPIVPWQGSVTRQGKCHPDFSQGILQGQVEVLDAWEKVIS